MASQTTSSAASRPHFFAGAGVDRPAFAATVMVVSLAMLGLQDALVKLASTEVSLWQFQLLRSSCNLMVLVVLSRFLWGTARPIPKRLWAVVLRSTFMVGAMVFFFGAVPFLALSQVAAGLYVFPLFVAILSALLLGEKVGPRRIAAILAGFTGTLLILKPGTDAFQWAALMPVGAGLCYAASVLTTRKLCREESPLTLAFGVAFSFVTVGIVGLAVTSNITPGELAAKWPYLATGWHPLELWVAGIVIACSALNVIATIGLTKAYQSAESSWLAPFDYSYLVFATFWAIVIWGDVPDILTFAGMALIAASGAYVAWRERRESDQRRAPGETAPVIGRHPTRLDYWSLPPY